jgi:RimJ/RimL family protein N-acetyltransferase
MTEFSVVREEIVVEGARAEFYLVPWDTEIFGQPVAQLDAISIENPRAGEQLIGQFQDWCAAKDIHLCTAKFPQEKTVEILFLQEYSFRVVEIAYTPVVRGLEQLSIPATEFRVEPARPEDEEALVAIAGTAFNKGRFRDDPRIGAELSDIRYAAWMRNSFKSNRQRVEKILDGNRLIGVFVTEALVDGSTYWWLTALAADVVGKGIAKTVWWAMMAQAQRQGASAIRTGISSHNLAVHNLYITLGFRISDPCVMLHWLRKPLTSVT